MLTKKFSFCFDVMDFLNTYPYICPYVYPSLSFLNISETKLVKKNLATDITVASNVLIDKSERELYIVISLLMSIEVNRLQLRVYLTSN